MNATTALRCSNNANVHVSVPLPKTRGAYHMEPRSSTLSERHHAASIALSTAGKRSCSGASFCSSFSVDVAQQPLTMSPGAIAGTIVVGVN